MMKRLFFLAALIVCAPAAAHAAALNEVRILTPAYTLTCVPAFHHRRVVLTCVPSRTPKRVARAAFGNWRYGDPMPYAIFAQTPPLGNGGPTLCDGTTLVCANGAVALNPAASITWTGTPTFSNGLTDNGTTAFTGATTVSGNTTFQTGTLTLSNGATVSGAPLTNTAQIQALGTGASSCSGVNYPAAAYGFCAGANNGTGNYVGIVLGPQATSFACTASCPVGDSARIAFFDSNASGAGGRECDLFKVNSIAAMESGCGLAAAGSNGLQASVLRNFVANDWNGTCASVATGPHCVTASRSGQTETGLTCYQFDVTNHAFAIDTGVTLSNAAAYTFTSTIPNGFVGSTSTAPTTGDTVTWFCLKP